MKITEAISDINMEAESLHNKPMPTDIIGQISLYKKLLIVGFTLVKFFTSKKADAKIDELIKFLGALP